MSPGPLAVPAPAGDAAAPPVPGEQAALDAGVAAALVRLEELDGAPVVEHVQVLDDVHRLLQDALATLDEV